MVSYLKKLVVFLVIGFVLGNLLGWTIINSDLGIKVVGLKKPFSILNKSKKYVDSDVILIGGSIANQLYSSSNNNSYTTWATVLMPGQFILVNNIIRHNPHVKEIIFLAPPSTLCRGFNFQGTFGSFVKPYLSFTNIKLISSRVIDYMMARPFSFAYIFPILKCDRIFSDINFRDPNDKPFFTNDMVLSDISVEYLLKLRDLAKSNNINLHFISPHINEDHFKELTNDWSNLKNQINELNLSDIFSGYFENMRYLDKSNFQDYGHYNKKLLSEEKNELVKEVLGESLYSRLTGSKKKYKPISYNGSYVLFNGTGEKIIEGKIGSIFPSYKIEFLFEFNPSSKSYTLSESTPNMLFAIGGWGVYEYSKNSISIYGGKNTSFEIPLKVGWHKIELISNRYQDVSYVVVNDVLHESDKNLKKQYLPLKRNYSIGKGYQQRYWKGNVAYCNLVNTANNKEIRLIPEL